MRKILTLHWLLTVDHSMRIEIRNYQKLAEVWAYKNETIIGHHPRTGYDRKRDKQSLSQ